jgi:hypothetical protein
MQSPTFLRGGGRDLAQRGELPSPTESSHGTAGDGKRWKEDQEAIAQQLATETQQWLKQTLKQVIEEASGRSNGQAS